MRYNSTASQLQICDTGSWENLISTADEATAPLSPNTGFFVITKDRFDGNLGGRLGANDKCVADLQTYDWLGKSTMQVDGDHVFAFICYGSYSCQDLMPNQTYTFAVSGDATLGGANFTTDSNSHGPGNNNRWNDNSHFGTGAKYYWMSERPSSGSTKWVNPDGNAGDNPNRCGGGTGNGWDNNSSAQTGEAGRTAFTGKAETGAIVGAMPISPVMKRHT